MKLVLGVLLVLLTAGCISNSGNGGGMMGQGGMMGKDQGGMMDKGTPTKEKFSSNGAAIYHTGFNLEGERVPVSGGPSWLYMHGGGCVDCHGADGKGGITPMMCDEKTPPITYHDLTEGEHEAHEGGEHAPYTDESIRKAIAEGIKPDGEEMDPCMPQWGMSDEDLDDVMGYLKTLSPKEEGH